MVKIIGAGPGAKDLITVRGMRALQEADVIIYAGSLVNEELLEYAKKECEIYNSAYMNLDEVIDVIVKAEQAGKKVVRLHTGDPSIYGAIREQIEVLATHGIRCEICPSLLRMPMEKMARSSIFTAKPCKVSSLSRQGWSA